MDQFATVSAFKNREASQELFADLRSYIDSLIDETLNTSEVWKELASENDIVYSSIKAFLLGKGKRLRPILFYLTYTACSETPDWFNVNKVMVAMELVHTFILVHDDIIDKSCSRRCQPTLHASFNSIINERYQNASPSISGEDMALVAGDLLYAFAIDTFRDVNLKPDVYAKSLNILTKVAMRTAHGEFKELLESLRSIQTTREADLFRVYDLKTAHYSFCAPMMLGAVLAENEDDIGALEQIALLWGRAFQIHNDLAELEAFGGNLDHIPPKDLTERRRTLILHWTYGDSDSAERTVIEDFLKNRHPDLSDYVSVYDVILRRGALDRAARLVDTLKADAKDLIMGLNMNDQSRVALEFYFNCLV